LLFPYTIVVSYLSCSRSPWLFSGPVPRYIFLDFCSQGGASQWGTFAPLLLFLSVSLLWQNFFPPLPRRSTSTPRSPFLTVFYSDPYTLSFPAQFHILFSPPLFSLTLTPPKLLNIQNVVVLPSESLTPLRSSLTEQLHPPLPPPRRPTFRSLHVPGFFFDLSAIVPRYVLRYIVCPTRLIRMERRPFPVGEFFFRILTSPSLSYEGSTNAPLPMIFIARSDRTSPL